MSRRKNQINEKNILMKTLTQILNEIKMNHPVKSNELYRLCWIDYIINLLKNKSAHTDKNLHH